MRYGLCGLVWRIRSRVACSVTLSLLQKAGILVCASACPRDVVAVVVGCNVPVILREKESHFELVPTCFVLGLMDGEAVERVKNGTAKEDILEIH